MSKSFRDGSDKSQQTELKELSSKSKLKGIGSMSDPTALTELMVKVAPSSMCHIYAEELYDALEFGVAYRTGASEPNFAFSTYDLIVYFMILIRERINQVNKARVLMSPKDTDVKTPHFFYMMLSQLGEVVDERRHLWIKVEFDSKELTTLRSEAAKQSKVEVGAETKYKMYKGEAFGSEEEKLFVYSMSKQLRLLERYGLVNGSALPRDTEGTLDFMLFLWVEGKLMHSDPDVEPALSVLASLLSFARDMSILNPYIPYGGEAAYRALLKDVTVLRNIS